LGTTSSASKLPPYSAAPSPGSLTGVTSWVVPNTPNGLVSDQSWFSVAGAPDGNVYMTACDHLTNSALFRLTPHDGALSYLGDARSASEAANNWLPWETAEKFHVRPMWFEGRVYVATADYSNQDDAYLNHRGFHWYAYDTPSRRFLDLSASEPNGVGAEHISIFSAAVDQRRGAIYALGSPTSHLYRYDIATGTTVDLGRSPLLTRTYYNPGRFLWVDSRGRVYFTVATAGTLAPGEPATPRYVLYWDPVEGWGAEPSWTIAEMLRTGQCSLDGKRCYILDYPLNLYVFDDEARTFTSLGRGVLEPQHISTRTRNVRVRSMQLSANEKKIYLINDSAPVNSLFEWDYASTPYPRELARVEGLDERLDARYTAFTGHDSWDEQGRVPSTPNVYFVRVDPVRLKAALGVLPGLATLSVRGQGADLHLVRHGDLTTDLQVILRVGDSAASASYQTLVAPAGIKVVPAPLDGRQSMKTVRVIPDGDTYAVSGSQ
jgi:hypothetical protein